MVSLLNSKGLLISMASYKNNNKVNGYEHVLLHPISLFVDEVDVVIGPLLWFTHAGSARCSVDMLRVRVTTRMSRIEFPYIYIYI